MIELSNSDKAYLHEVVEIVLTQCIEQGKKLSDISFKHCSSKKLLENAGAFVSYYSVQNGEKNLRGCIGIMANYYPLWECVARMAYSASLEDSRFLPIKKTELPYITWEITVLSPYIPCTLREIVLGKHGIVFEYKEHRAVFLPQVPLEYGWSLEQTLDNLAIKAGLPCSYWQNEDAKFFLFEGIILEK